VALPTLVVGALVALVAIAATGSTPGGTSETRSPPETLYDILYTLGLVAVPMGFLLLVYGLLQRKEIQREIASGRYRRATLVGLVAFVALFTGLFYLGIVKMPKRVQKAPPDDGAVLPPGSPLQTQPGDAETSYTPSVAWIPIVVLVCLLLAGVTAYWLSERRARRSRALGARPLALQLADVLDETLDDLRAEDDPRRAVIASYARLERVLAANGIPRSAAETSNEYLDRVLRSLDLAPDAIARLTRLFTRSKFSQHDVDLAMKEEAITALEQVRDELRRSRAAPGAREAPELAEAAP
jgi:hypothetical protein